MKKPVGFLLFLISCAIGLLSQQPPHLTDQQKLKIRSAQVDFFQAKTNLEQTPQYQQFQMAQAKVNQVVQEVLKESGVSQKDFRLGEDLEFLAIAPPSPKPEPSSPPKK